MRTCSYLLLVSALLGCAPLARIDEKSCSASCVDSTTRLVCDEAGTPRAEPCPEPQAHCARAACNAGQCSIAPDVGKPCGPDGLAMCNEGYACLGPNLRLSAILHHTCAATDDGKVFCWGTNLDGGLGDGTRDPSGNPVLVRGLPGPAKDVSTGYAHTCALLETGEIYCWGNNLGGQCGTGSSSDALLNPVLVDAPGILFTAVVAGQGHTCGLTDGAEVYCWGHTSYGQCGVDPAVAAIVPPTKIPNLALVQSLDTVKDHTCAITAQANTMFCWGYNLYNRVRRGEPPEIIPVGKLGPAAAGLEYSATPVPVELGGVVVDVGMGFESTYALMDGAVYAWGYNERRQLGVESDARVVLEPTRVMGDYDTGHRELREVRNIGRSDGSDQCVEVSIHLLTGTRHMCWGGNDEGELALGPDAPILTIYPFAKPTVLPGTARNLVRGENHGCAILIIEDKHEIHCWGAGDLVGNGGVRVVEKLPPVLSPTPVKWLPELFPLTSDGAESL